MFKVLDEVKQWKVYRLYDVYFSRYNFGLIYRPKTILFFILNFKQYFK